MAVPKRKTSKARRDKRRNSHWKVTAPSLATCSECGARRLPHRVCKACGSYKGRVVLEVEDSKR